MTTSMGYEELVKLRNRAPDGVMREAELAKIPEMFRSSTTTAKKRRLNAVGAAKSAKVDIPETVEIEIPAFAEYDAMPITVKGYKKLNDTLAVAMNANVLDRLIRYIRFMGFDAGKYRPKRESSGNKGIWTLKDGSIKYIVTFPGGGYKVRKADTMDDAISRQAHDQHVADAGGNPCHEVDEDDDDDECSVEPHTCEEPHELADNGPLDASAEGTSGEPGSAERV